MAKKKSNLPHDHLAPLRAALIEDTKPLTLDDALVICGNKNPDDAARKVCIELLALDTRFHLEGNGEALRITLALGPDQAAGAEPAATTPPAAATPAADPARAAIDQEKKAKGKPDPFIDRAVEWLQGQQAASATCVTVTIDQLLKEAYATKATPAAVLGFLKQAKADGRLFLIQRDGQTFASVLNDDGERAAPAATVTGGDGGAGESASGGAGPAANAEASSPPAKAEEPKTLGEHLQDAQGRPTRLPFSHGPGTWVGYLEPVPAAPGHLPKPPVPARIVNMATSGNVTLYDLKTEHGKTVKGVAAFEIEQLSPQEECRVRDHEALIRLRKHNDTGAALAQELANAQAREVEQSADLKATRKVIEKLRDRIDEHLSGVPAEGQTRVDFDDDGSAQVTAAGKAKPAATTAAAVEKPTAPAAPPQDGTTAEQRLEARIVGKDALELTGDNQPWDKLAAAQLQDTHSTGKAPKVVPIELPQAAGKWVVAEVRKGFAVLLQAYPRDEWRKKYEERFDAPRDIPSQCLTSKQEAGGKLCGFPVKVGRATLYLAPLDEALLLLVPAAALAGQA